tara:strand:- start:138 stop:368 length:231 start_codon:yes stop_codon:yes gene_type:complete
MSIEVVNEILTEEFSDLVVTAVLKDYYDTVNAILEDEYNHHPTAIEHNIKVANAITIVLNDFLNEDDFKEWLEERT